jgi:hypothetical protein
VTGVFTVHCPNHRAEVLLGSSAITGVRNARAGIELDWRCRCGATGTLRFRGHRVAAPTPAAAPPPAPVPAPVPTVAPAAAVVAA